MANTANVGFFGPNNPSIQAQQQQLAISKALAEQLTKAGSEQSQTEFAGGLAVPQSSAVGAGKMAQMLAGAYINRKSQDKANDLATNSYNSMAGMYGAPQYPAASEDHGTILSRMLGMNDSPATAGGTPVGQAQTIPTAIPGQPSPQELASAMGAPNAQAPQASPEPQTPFKLNGFSGQDSMMLAQTNPEAYAKILENQHHMTDKMIENQYAGITPGQFKTTVLAPVASQLQSGTVQMDANGNPTLTPTPGAASIIQQNKRAEAAGTPTKNTMTMADGSVRTDVPTYGNGEIITPQMSMPNNPTAQKFGQPVQVTQPPSLPAGQPAAPNSMDSVLASAQQPQGQSVIPPVGNLSNVPPQPTSFGADPAAMKKNAATAEAAGAEDVKLASGAIMSKELNNKLKENVKAMLGLNSSVPTTGITGPETQARMSMALNGITGGAMGGKDSDNLAQYNQLGHQLTLNGFQQLVASGAIRGSKQLLSLVGEGNNVSPEGKTVEGRAKILNNLLAELNNTATASANQSNSFSGGQSAPYQAIPASPAGTQAPGKLLGTSGGKKVYELPNGTHVMEQ